MGLLDTLKSGAAALLSSKGLDGVKIVSGVSDLINNQGGIEGLTKQFHEKGMGDIVNSWISTGKNLPISAQQIQAVIGPERIAAISSKIGVDPNVATAKLQEYLPMIIDKLTPAGKVENNTVSADAITSTLGNLLK